MTRLFKIGGNVIENEELLDAFCRDFAKLDGPKLIVHGGGVMASKLQEALGQKPLKIEGRRVTDADALKAVVMAYSGWCNKSLVARLQKYGCNAIGLSGCDANVIRASKRPPRLLMDGVTEVDYGYVGDVCKDSVNAPFIKALLDMGLVPVFCAINHDGNAQLLNTNADTIASSVASAIGASLICCFELDGVLLDRNDPSSVIASINEAAFARMKADGTIADGMIPKIENCLKALREGASGAVIKNAARITDESGTVVEL